VSVVDFIIINRMEEDDLFHSQLLYNKINGKEIKIDRVEIEDSRKRVNS